MKMKRLCCLILLSLTVSLAVIAQPDGAQPPVNDPPRIMGLKMAFITKQLNLSNDDAQKFWPIYYSYTAELKKARQGAKDDILVLEENMLNVRKKYRTEFKKVLLTDDRVNKALTVDRDFSNVIRKELLQRAKMRMPKQPRAAGGSASATGQ